MKLITRVVLLAAALVLPAMASAGTYVSITVAPPPLPVYAQPVCPGDGYIWTPGYWAWDGAGYYWVPGVWVLAPAVNVFWTPGYWGWAGGYYTWNAGYWGPHVGFYGGVNYGYGYGGVGYVGGRWQRGHFHYNRAVNNINIVNVHNTYNTTVVNHNHSRVSFNGGDRGTRARPTSREIAAGHDRRMGPTNVQQRHLEAARDDRSSRFSQDRGGPGNTRPSSSDRPRMMHAPDVSSRPSRERMPSSGFAERADHVQRNEQHNEPRMPRGNGAMNDRADRPQREAMPSSAYGSRERSQGNEGRVIQRDAPRTGNPGAMGRPEHPRMGGGEMRRNEGPGGQPQHRREQR